MTEPTAPKQSGCLKVHPFEAMQAHRPYLAFPSATDRLWHMHCGDCDTIVCEDRHERILYARDTAILAIAVPERLRCRPNTAWRPEGHDPSPMWPQVHFQIPDDLPAKWRTSRPPRWYIWAVLYRIQQGRCAGCWSAPPAVIDHAHWNRQVRGLLCAACNLREWRCKHQPHCLDEYLTAPPARKFRWVYSSNNGAVKRDPRPTDPKHELVLPERAPSAAVEAKKPIWEAGRVPKTDDEVRAQIKSLVGQIAHREGLDHQAVNTQILQAGYPARQKAQMGGLLRIREYLIKRVQRPVGLDPDSPKVIAKAIRALPAKKRALLEQHLDSEM